MLNLVLTTDKLALITSAAATVDVHASFVDLSGTTVTPGKQNTAITTAATTDIVAVPAASTVRNVKTLHIRNKHATAPVDVTVQYNANAVLFEVHKVTLLAGEGLEYIEGVGFFVAQTTRKAFFNRRVTADSVHATISTFADVTGLTCPVQSGKHYNWEAHLYHVANATTTGARFAFNGPTINAARVAAIDVITVSATAAAMGSAITDVVLRDTAVIVETTGALAGGMVIVSGWLNPSADGTFAVRASSNVTVAAGLTIKVGSWLQLWEADN